MSAQAKPSLSFDSPQTSGGGCGSLFAQQSGACGGVGEAATAAALPLGLYVHVPFCSSTCDFCAFYQEKPRRQSIDLYLEAVAAELAQVCEELRRGIPWLWQGEAALGGAEALAGAGNAPAAPAHPIAPDAPVLPKLTFTVFFGGGTPGLLPAEDLGRLCAMVSNALGEFGDIVEWSIELAPATVRPDRVKTLLEHGVTRFSLGVQSFSDELLDGLGRQHSRKQIFAAFETLRSCGAKNISCDLMFALPGQTREAWLTDLQTLADLAPEHISTYCLTFEEDTAMWVKLSQGRYKLDPEREADLYRETWAWLASAGYAQYEVSNFAREGFRSRHNLATWSMGRWRGVGPSAASQWGGWRFQNPANLEGWAGAVLSKNTPKAVWPPVQSEERVELTNRLLAADALIFGLRRRDGVNRAQWLARFAQPQAATPAAVAPVAVIATASTDIVTATATTVAATPAPAASMPAAPVTADTTDGATAGTTAGSESATVLPLAELEKLFERFHREGLLDVAALEAGIWRLNDEGLLLADAVGGQLLECFDTD